MAVYIIIICIYWKSRKSENKRRGFDPKTSTQIIKTPVTAKALCSRTNLDVFTYIQSGALFCIIANNTPKDPFLHDFRVLQIISNFHSLELLSQVGSKKKFPHTVGSMFPVILKSRNYDIFRTF